MRISKTVLASLVDELGAVKAAAATLAEKEEALLVQAHTTPQFRAAHIIKGQKTSVRVVARVQAKAKEKV